MLALQALYQGKHSASYNLGNGCGFTVKEVIEAAEFVTGRQISKEIAPRRAGDPAVLIASSEKIRAELGWNPEYQDIRSIIDTAWKWHKNHPDGFGS
ncbi:hypothetical protein HA075_12625 [bacterium BFN5]|nr:hypothetical protein HA075_12625 [bacterium BFN5]